MRVAEPAAPSPPAMGLSITVLGAAGSYPGPGEACSGYLVRSPGATTLVDLGSGVLANLQQHVAIADLDAVVITHEHPDHWLDLPVLRNAMKYVLELEGLPVYGPAAAEAKVRLIVEELAPTLLWTAVEPGSEVAIGDQALRFSRTAHPVDTLAVRVDAEGRSLAYSADTGPEWAVDGWLEGVDLLVAEATLPEAYVERAPELHLTGRLAGELAQAGGVGRLLLTHLTPGIDRQAQLADATAAFAGPVDLAVVHETYEV
jgi:ribonuclease BN (tRNA processing enzyme)